MFDEVIVGIEGAVAGRDPISVAKQLAADDAELTLAHVYNPQCRLRDHSRRASCEARTGVAALARGAHAGGDPGS